jgi:hypothetical protein
MKNIKEKSINYGLKTLTILAFASIFVPFSASAQVYGGYGESGYNYVYSQPIQVQTRPQTQPSDYIYTRVIPTQTVYSKSRANNNTTVKRTTTESNTTNNSSNTSTSRANDNTNTGSNLAANAIFGENGFLPSGIVQWVLFAIFVLLIVILVRTVFGVRAKYEATPLKYD